MIFSNIICKSGLRILKLIDRPIITYNSKGIITVSYYFVIRIGYLYHFLIYINTIHK